MTTAHSGRPIDDITVDAAQAGQLELDDIRISRESLVRQAEVAESAGSAQLGANLRRAAELTALPADRVLEIYEALRPGRSSADELAEIAEELDAVDAVTCAQLVREAAAVHARRGLLR